jgi:hypothetical protein
VTGVTGQVGVGGYGDFLLTKGLLMNAITMLTQAVVHPVQTSTAVVGQVVELATAGVKLSTRVVGWAVSPGQPVTGQAASSAGAPPLTVAGMHDVRRATDAPMPDIEAHSALTEEAVTSRPSNKDAPVVDPPSTTSGDGAGAQTEGPTVKKVTSKKVAAKTTGKKTTGKKKTGEDTIARKAPSAKAATLAPALAQRRNEEAKKTAAGRRTTSEASQRSSRSRGNSTAGPQPDPEPLLDPSVAKAIRSETRTLQKASNLHKD